MKAILAVSAIIGIISIPIGLYIAGIHAVYSSKVYMDAGHI
jgi:ethanolamine transporter EutH